MCHGGAIRGWGGKAHKKPTQLVGHSSLEGSGSGPADLDPNLKANNEKERRTII